MTTTNDLLLQLSTVHSAVEELHKQNIQLCAFNQDGVHLLDSLFVELFQDKREIVGRKDLSKEYHFMYYTHIFGTKFYCISNNPELFPTYPVEKLAQDLLSAWDCRKYKDGLGVYYVDGSYMLLDKETLVGQPIYTFEQYESDESVTLEQAILDHMEVVHNANK